MDQVIYPGLDALKKEYVTVSKVGDKVYGHSRCWKCGGTGNYCNRAVCYGCSGRGYQCSGLRIDEQGWIARQKAGLKRQVSAAKIKAEKEALRLVAQQNNAKALGFDITSALALYAGNAFITDILTKANRYPLSEAQIKAVHNAIQQISTRTAEKESMAHIELAPGRQEIRGKIMTIRAKDTEFGMVYKMTLKREDGFTFYGTLPKGIAPEVGDTISMQALPEKKDSGFAFYSRPTKPVIIERGPAGTQRDLDKEEGREVTPWAYGK